MQTRKPVKPLLDLFALTLLLSTSLGAAAKQGKISRAHFPPDFIFGTATSAYQYEGAAREDGRGPSIWDTFTQQRYKIVDGSNGNVADDGYHHYKDDIQLISNMGMDFHRFSISWSRIMPYGKGRINQLGLDYYNNLIDGLLEKGIQPFVTLFHFDLPQALQDAYGGWLSPNIVDDFVFYAEICFKAFGDRVKHWITFNEPNVFILYGYNNGTFPPARCSKYVGTCVFGDSATEPYLAAHNVLLSHAAAAKLYKHKYQTLQAGAIGITVNTAWYVPSSNSTEDRNAAERALDFLTGWFLDPIMLGDYPASMRTEVKDRLPSFHDTQRDWLSMSLDFIGLNYYSAYYVAGVSHPNDRKEKDFFYDMKCYFTGMRKGRLIGPQAPSSWIFMVPMGLYNIVDYVKTKYNNPPIYITENGVGETNNSSSTLKQALRDHVRVQYHKVHLSYLSKVIRDGADVRGYFTWSLLDNFEWISGYSIRFGLYHVDYETMKRYPKTSANWFKRFLAKL